MRLGKGCQKTSKYIRINLSSYSVCLLFFSGRFFYAYFSLARLDSPVLKFYPDYFGTKRASYTRFYRRDWVLKNLPRTGWRFQGIKDAESVADHCYRVSLLSMILADLLATHDVRLGRRKGDADGAAARSCRGPNW